MKYALVLFIVTLGVITLGISTGVFIDEEARSLKRYCETVERSMESNNRYGFPDYQGIYEESCQ